MKTLQEKIEELICTAEDIAVNGDLIQRNRIADSAASGAFRLCSAEGYSQQDAARILRDYAAKFEGGEFAELMKEHFQRVALQAEMAARNGVVFRGGNPDMVATVDVKNMLSMPGTTPVLKISSEPNPVPVFTPQENHAPASGAEVAMR